jgi:hypothetical protein
MSIGDSAAVRGAAVIGVVLFALYVIGTWDKEGAARDAPQVVTKAATPVAPKNAPQGAVQAPTGLWGILLGEKFGKYASSHGPFDKEATRPGASKKYPDEETYVQRKGQLHVGVRKGLVSSIAYSCKEGSDPTAMYTVACHAAPQRINAVFGDRFRVLCPKLKPDDPNKDLAAFVRAYDVIEYQTRYIVIKDAMTGFIVYEPGELETLVGINWETCPGGKAAAR